MSFAPSELALAELWGIGEADPLLLGAVLLAVVICAIAFLASRAKATRRRRKAGD